MVWDIGVKGRNVHRDQEVISIKFEICNLFDEVRSVPDIGFDAWYIGLFT